MKKRLAIIMALVGLALTLGGCQFPVSFVLMNHTGEVMEVSYTFKASVEFSCPTGEEFTMSPVVRGEADLGNRDMEWAALKEGEFVCEAEARTVYVPVAAGIALRIAEREDPGDEYGQRDIKNFPIERLSITGPGGSMEFKGTQVLKAFTRSETVPGTFYLVFN